MRRLALFASLSIAFGLGLAGCNVIFGIQPGESSATTSGTAGTGPSGGAGAGAGGAQTTGGGGTGGTTASGGTGGVTTGSGGTGGAPACPPERIPPCHPNGGGGAVCDPIQISGMDTGYTIGLAMVGDYLHWANGSGKVVRVKYDGSPDSTFGDGNDSVFLAASDTHVFYTDWYDGVIRAGSLDASHTLFDVTAMTGDAMMTPNAYLGRIVFRNGILYFAGEDPNAVWTAPADGSQVYATKVADKIDGTQSTDVSNGVAVDDTHVYWTDADKIRRLPLDQIPGGTSEIFATDAGAGDLAVDDQRVYWTSAAGVASRKKDMSSPTLLPVSGNRARSLLLEGNYIYWAESGGRIVRADKGGDMSTAKVVALGPQDAYGLAVDCGAVYWSTFDFNYGTVYKVRKPDL